MKNSELTFDSNSPAEFIQPLLVLHFCGDRCGKQWFVEIEGNIDLYLRNWTFIKNAFAKIEDQDRRIEFSTRVFNWLSQATVLLHQLLAQLSMNGLEVDRVYGYEGSFQPTHLLRSGILFQRMTFRQSGAPKTLIRTTEWPDLQEFLPDLSSKERCTLAGLADCPLAG